MPELPRPKLILTDIDGTILPYGQKAVGQEVLRSFHRALDAGILIGPASGRGRQWVEPLLCHDSACYDTALASNGMELYLGGERFHEELLPTEALGQLAEELRHVDGAGLLYFRGADPLLVEGSLCELEKCFPAYASRAARVESLPREPTIKANVFLNAGVDEMRCLADRLEQAVPALSFDVPQPGWLNVMTRGWGKAAAIDLMCQRLQIGLDEVVAFGDGGNDVSMLSHVPNSFAVAGAVAEAREAARWVIGPVEEDAVPAAIEALVCGELPDVLA